RPVLGGRRVGRIDRHLGQRAPGGVGRRGLGFRLGPEFGWRGRTLLPGRRLRGGAGGRADELDRLDRRGLRRRGGPRGEQRGASGREVVRDPGERAGRGRHPRRRGRRGGRTFGRCLARPNDRLGGRGGGRDVQAARRFLRGGGGEVVERLGRDDQ